MAKHKNRPFPYNVLDSKSIITTPVMVCAFYAGVQAYVHSMQRVAPAEIHKSQATKAWYAGYDYGSKHSGIPQDDE